MLCGDTYTESVRAVRMNVIDDLMEQKNILERMMSLPGRT